MKTIGRTLKNKEGWKIEIYGDETDKKVCLLDHDNETIFTFSDEEEVKDFADILIEMLNTLKE
jgi:hypothetical protein